MYGLWCKYKVHLTQQRSYESSHKYGQVKLAGERSYFIWLIEYPMEKNGIGFEGSACVYEYKITTHFYLRKIRK